MSHLGLMLNHLPNVEVFVVCVVVFTLIIVTWHPESGLEPKIQMSYANTKLKRTTTTVLTPCLDCLIELEGAMPLDLENTPNLELYANHEFTEVKPGGRWSSSKCQDPLAVAIIIPFRDPFGDRIRNLKYLITQLHYILQRHLLKYVIIVSQQNGTEGYMNKGLLMNLAFQHINNYDEEYGCVVFNDVDLIPVSDQIFYGCDVDNPKHMSTYIDKKIITDEKTTQGVMSMPSTIFKVINGFSNRFWGCVNKDDDMYNRIISEVYILQRSDPEAGQYHDMGKSCNSTFYKSASANSYKSDGLNSLQEVEVKLIETKLLPLYTLLNYAVKQPDFRNISNSIKGSKQ